MLDRSHAFQAAPHLELLQLSNDHIHTLHMDSFSGLYSLKELHVYNNQISALPKGLFVDLSQLLYLNLDHNDLKYIHVDDMSQLQQLKVLSLANNAIATLDGSFCRLKNLPVLDLHSNQMTTIPAQLFQNSTLLQTLNVSHNHIEHIAEDALLNMAMLESLALNSNKLWDSQSHNLAKALRGRKLKRVIPLKLSLG